MKLQFPQVTARLLDGEEGGGPSVVRVREVQLVLGMRGWVVACQWVRDMELGLVGLVGMRSLLLLLL